MPKTLDEEPCEWEPNDSSWHTPGGSKHAVVEHRHREDAAQLTREACEWIEIEARVAGQIWRKDFDAATWRRRYSGEEPRARPWWKDWAPPGACMCSLPKRER